MKLFLIPLFACAVILPRCSHAHEDKPITILPINNIVNYTSVTNYYQDTGVAAAIAQSQLHFDGSTHRLQIAVGAGTYNSESSLAVGAALKLGASGPLISGSISQDSSHTGLGAGITFRF